MTRPRNPRPPAAATRPAGGADASRSTSATRRGQQLDSSRGAGEAAPKSGRGGARLGAGRKARGGEPGRNVTIRMSEEEIGEVAAALGEGETVSDFGRAAMLAEARRRRSR